MNVFISSGKKAKPFFPRWKLLISMGSSPVTLPRLRGTAFSRRRVRLGVCSFPRRLAADLAIAAASTLNQRAPGAWSPESPPTKGVLPEGPNISSPPAKGPRWGLNGRTPNIGKDKAGCPPRRGLDGKTGTFLDGWGKPPRRAGQHGKPPEMELSARRNRHQRKKLSPKTPIKIFRPQGAPGGAWKRGTEHLKQTRGSSNRGRGAADRAA